MFSVRTILICVILVIVNACAQDNRVVKQVQFSRDMPAWRSSMRVKQVQGNFPRLSSFYEGGSRPLFFANWAKRLEDE